MGDSSDPSRTARVRSIVREEDDVANQELTQKLTQLRKDISELKVELHFLKINLFGVIFCGGIIVVVAVIIFLTSTHSFDANLLNVSEMTGVKTLPPYYLIAFASFVGTALELFLLGPPAYQSKEKAWWHWKEIAATLFRAYLLMAFLYNVYVDAAKTFAFAQHLLKLDLPTINVVCDVMAFLLLQMSTGGNADDSIKRFALFLLVSHHVKFFIAHSGKPVDLENARGLPDKMLCDANGPLFTLWWLLMIPYVLAFGAVWFTITIPVAIIYFWITIPIVLFYYFLSDMVIHLLTAISNTTGQTPEYQPLIAGVPFQPLEESELERIRFVGRSVANGYGLFVYGWNAYAYDLKVLRHTKVCNSALKVFLLVSLALPVAIPFVMSSGIRLLNGHGYMPAVLETIGERHWYTFLDACTENVQSFIDVIGRLL